MRSGLLTNINKFIIMKQTAQNELLKGFKQLNEADIQQMKYFIWDEFENLLHLYDINSFDFDFLYYNYLDMVISKYSRFLCADLPSKSKIGKFLIDHDFAEKYNMRSFPDKHFSIMFVDALKTDNISRKTELACALKEHVINNMGGFDIGCYSLRTPVK